MRVWSWASTAYVAINTDNTARIQTAPTIALPRFRLISAFLLLVACRHQHHPEDLL